MKFNIWNKWGRLRSTILGNMYTPEYFSTIKDDKIRTPLQWIVEETLEDLEYFKSVLQEAGVEVIQPKLEANKTFDDFVESRGGKIIKRIPAPPLTPRDHFGVVGDSAYCFLNREKDPDTFDLCESLGFEYVGDHSALGARQFMVGRDFYVNVNTGSIEAIDNKNPGNIDSFLSTIQTKYPELRIHRLLHAGHTDGAFHPLKPGAALTLEYPEYYKDTYPGWDFCFLEGESWDKVHGFLNAKFHTDGSFWIPGEEDNKELSELIKTWLTDWVGYVEETVFDVNVLMLDEHHMFTLNADNPKVKEFAKKHNIELIHIPWRHRYFWDGGLHCITQELYRDGVMEDYWPEGRDIVVQTEEPQRIVK